jgi:hypothetical protein
MRVGAVADASLHGAVHRVVRAVQESRGAQVLD